ncbi:hypothetical protein GCM10022243_59030 [Saccharothrix violaceirubra]|uniref:Histidine decarboxylase n=1 Tax=Saccharothrix violaceirubra TaxID=413306 RepID=A0A7W7WV58_9PSEU|nr:pyridoxal-dependent decarboxylase [Saccharothrix violaceirubra]MBB4964940.1 histidine decarboxylase [Saccharothrix violaceirubra]
MTRIESDTQTFPEVDLPSQDVWSAVPPAPPHPDQFKLGPEALDPAARMRALDGLNAYLDYRRDHLLGYQVNEDMNAYRQDLSRFLTKHVNNIGDPFQDGGLKVNSKIAEQAVLNYFSTLWHGAAYDPRNRESIWGYVLSMGSTEGNMYALWNARDYLAGRRLLGEDGTDRPVLYQEPMIANVNPNAYKPIAFYSQDTHYSFAKAVRVLDLPTFSRYGREHYRDENPLGGPWPDEVPSEGGPEGKPSTYGPGSIDVAALAKLVEFFAGKGHPIIVSLNLGSTFKGAYDDVRQVADTLLPIFERHGLVDRVVEYEKGQSDRRRGFWIHVDGALGGSYLPFLRMAAENPKYDYHPPVPVPEFDFGLRSATPTVPSMDMVSSIVCSGHKWMGSPMLCGVVATKVKYQMQPPDNPEYIGSQDTTFAGSRNGFTPIVMWDHIAKNSYDRQVSLTTNAQRMAEYLEQKLLGLQAQKESTGKPAGWMWIDRTPLALTVRFRRPNSAIVAKWSLSTVSMLMEPGDPMSRRDLAHIFLMASATPEKIDAFISDLHADNAFDDHVAPTIAAPSQTFGGRALSATTHFADRGFA